MAGTRPDRPRLSRVHPGRARGDRCRRADRPAFGPRGLGVRTQTTADTGVGIGPAPDRIHRAGVHGAVAHRRHFPWWMVQQPTFRVGLLLQLPVGLVVYLVARLLLRTARAIGAVMRRPLAVRSCRSVADGRLSSVSFHVPRLSVQRLAAGVFAARLFRWLELVAPSLPGGAAECQANVEVLRCTVTCWSCSLAPPLTLMGAGGAWAHDRETNNGVTVTLHVDPNDAPVTGQPATLVIESVETKAAFRGARALHARRFGFHREDASAGSGGGANLVHVPEHGCVPDHVRRTGAEDDEDDRQEAGEDDREDEGQDGREREGTTIEKKTPKR